MTLKFRPIINYKQLFPLSLIVFFAVFISLIIFIQKNVYAAPTVVKTTSGKVFFDDFNRVSLGSGYTAEGMGASGWNMSSNRVRYTSSGAGGQATLKSNTISSSGDKIYEFLFNVSSFSSVTPRIQAQKSDDTNFYWFDSDFGNSAGVFNNAGGQLLSAATTFSPNTDYRIKMRLGTAAAGETKLWINESLAASGNNASPLTAAGTAALWAADFGGGSNLDYDNLAIYNSTNLTVNGTYGSWGLYKNDGTTRIGACNTGTTTDYATLTSFPPDYSAGPAAQIKVFASGNTDCSGSAAASFTGSSGDEIFGGDGYTYDESGADITPPVRSNGLPTGSLGAGTVQTTLSLTTDENATCRYSTTAGTAYAAMTNTFSTTGTTSHSTQVTGLSNGNSYNYYVRCSDSLNNVNNNDFTITFSVASPGFQNQTIFSGLNFPVQSVFLPDGRMLVLEKEGAIKIAQAGSSTLTPFMTITNIDNTEEQGLMSLVIDPNFSTNGYFYVFYTRSSPLLDRLSRFTAVGNSASLSSEVVIWQDDNALGLTTSQHRAGYTAFGPDGKLYFTVGDHMTASTVQDLSTNYGKVHRINPDGTIPTDNPFYDGALPNKDSIWATGLRNPYRFYIDPTNSEMILGDVGELSWEEINRIEVGKNYGWPQCEGNCAVSGMTNPIHSYFHEGGGFGWAVTAGFRYKGTQFPPEYQNSFFFGDYGQGWIKRLTFNPDGSVNQVLNFEPADGAPFGPTGNPVHIMEGPDGSLYYVDIGFGPNIGTVRKMSYFSGNQPPVASASATPISGASPLTVDFSSAGSLDPEGQPITFNWDFGDASSSAQPNPTHVYQNDGLYAAKLTVSDGNSQTISPLINIEVGNKPVATILTPANNLPFQANNLINYSGEATDADETLGASAFSWTILFHHDEHIHPFLDNQPGTSGNFTIADTGHDYRGTTKYEIILTVTDSSGLKDTKSVFIQPQKVNITFNTLPAGLDLVIDGITKTTSIVYDTLIGFKHNLNALDQVFSGNSYNFQSWSDGGTRNHDIIVPNTDQTYTATYQPAAGLNKTSSGKLYFDDFNRATLGSGYTPEGGGASNWSMNNNRLRYITSGFGGQALMKENTTTFSGDKIYEFLFNSSVNDVPRFQAQKVDGSNYYWFDADHGNRAKIFKTVNYVNTTLTNVTQSYSTNTDYRIKMRVGSNGTSNTKLWVNEVARGTGTNSSPIASPGFAAFWAADFNGGRRFDFDNLSIYTSTSLVVNGTFGRWALYRNDGTTRIGPCNSAATVDYATSTSFPPDYSNGSAAKIKVFPTGNTTCTGTASATYSGSAGNEIFGGDVYSFTP